MAPVLASTMNARFFDHVYRNQTDYYGHDVRQEFVRFVGELPPKARVLEIGSGQGRHALYVAATGRPVHAVDYSQVATDQLNTRALREGLPITASCMDATDLRVASGAYDAVVMVSLLSHLDRAAFPALVGRSFGALTPGGRVFIEAFTVEDPGYRGAADASETAVALKTYLRSGELRELFAPFAITDYREFIEDDLAHGPAHRHGVALLVGERPASSA